MRAAWRGVVFALAMGCGAARTPAVMYGPPAAVDAGATRKQSSYLLLTDAATGGALMGQMRIEPGPDGPIVARDAPSDPIEKAWRLPKSLGGYLFQTKFAGFYYSSTTFTGSLAALAKIERVEHVASAPDFVLLTTNGGRRVAIDPRTRQIVPVRPAGLVDVATLDDGRVVELFQDRSLLVSKDAGRTWAPLAHRGVVTAVRVENQSIEVQLQDDTVWVLDEHGALAAYPSRKVRRPTSAPDEDEDPRVCAARRGIMLGDVALCVHQGLARTLDLPTGRIHSESKLPGEVDPRARCEAMHAGAAVVIVCASTERLWILSWRDGNAAVEKSFHGWTDVSASPNGALAVRGKCAPDDKDRRSGGVVCARSIDGNWRELDAHTGKNDHVRPNGAWSTVVFDGRCHPDRYWAIADDGKLSRWAEPSPATHGPRALEARDGHVMQTTDFGKTWTEVAAPPGTTLANDKWYLDPECSDIGCYVQPFIRLGWPVDGPEPFATPEIVPVSDPVADEVPTALPRLDCTRTGPERRSAEGTPASGEASQPYYVEPAVFGVRGHDDFVVGGSDDSDRLRAMIFDPTRERHSRSTRRPKQATARSTRLDVRYVTPFEPNAGLRRAALVLPPGDQKRLADRGIITLDAHSDGPYYCLGAWEEMSRVRNMLVPFPPARSRVAIPVATREPAAPVDVVLPGDGLYVWLRSAGTPNVFHATQANDDVLTLAGAAATARDEISLLLLRKDGGARIVAATSNDVRTVADIEPTVFAAKDTFLETLAVDRSGRLAILATYDSSRPPTRESPAKLVVPGEPPRSLAPWDEILLGNVKECAPSPDLWSAIVTVPEPWLELHDAKVPVREKRPFVARVRWSETRLCLDAVEISDRGLPPSDETSGEDDEPAAVIARFLPKPSSARVALGKTTRRYGEMQCVLRGR
jgi:hypothetical protein